MLRGFIVGAVVGLIAMAGLMVAFPMGGTPGGEAMQATPPAAPETGAGEGTEGGDAAGGEAAPAEEGGDAGAEGAGDDQSRAPEAAPEGETAATATTPADPAAPATETAEAPTESAEAAAPEAETTPAAAEPVEVASAANPTERAAAAGARRLPSVARPEDTLTAPAQDPAALPAWRRNAIAFEDDAERPLLAVVLTVRPGGPAAETPLGKVGAPLTLAVSPAGREAAEAARLYREAGLETMLLLSLSPADDGRIAPGLGDAEIAETVRSLVDAFDSVVGLANPGASRNADSRVARVVMEELAAAGLGYLHALGGAGAGTEVRAARDNGVPMARHVRLIEDGLDEAAILQSLDLAAFDARRRGAAVAMGAPSEAMVRALVEWVRENDGRGARLAPFSAVLARLAREG